MATYRLWPSTNGPASVTNDASDYTLGTEFYVTAAANATAVLFWRPTDSPPTVALSVGIYRVDSSTAGTLVASVTGISSPNSGGWHRIALTSPVALVPNQRYRVVAQSATNSFYASTASYWLSGAGASGITNGILVAPKNSDAIGQAQGAFNVGATMAFPTGSFNGGNYWVDVEVEDAPAGGTRVELSSVTAAQSGGVGRLAARMRVSGSSGSSTASQGLLAARMRAGGTTELQSGSAGALAIRGVARSSTAAASALVGRLSTSVALRGVTAVVSSTRGNLTWNQPGMLPPLARTMQVELEARILKSEKETRVVLVPREIREVTP